MSKSNCRFLLRSFSIVLFISLLFSDINPLEHPTNAFAGIDTPEDISTQREMFQYTSARHVLGFEPGGLYLATGSHMLRVEFVGTQGTTPIADQVPIADGQTRPPGSLSYPNLWPGITLTYDSPPGAILRSTYHIAAGANAEQIHLRYNVPLQIDAGGNLNFVFETGTLTASAPVAWQEIDGQSIPIEVAFASLEPDNEVSFQVGAYDSTLPLIIDPTLIWHTFLGSSDEDRGNDIAVDDDGNVYVTGKSEATWGDPVNPYAGDFDAFVAKLNSSGELVWNTFLGSANDPLWYDNDMGRAIALDSSGNVYVAGWSGANWGDPVNPHTASSEVFVAKLNNDGVLQWNTFWGDPCGSIDDCQDMAVDESGNSYVTGQTYTYRGQRAFVFKLNSNGVEQWDTYLGETVTKGRSVAVDDSGNSYVTGYSRGTFGDPIVPYTPGTGSDGILNDDAFVAKLNTSGGVVWNTFMGSSNDEFGTGIALDSSGNVYVSGKSYGDWGEPVEPNNGMDTFVAKLNNDGVRQWNTFYDDWCYSSNDPAIDAAGNIYLPGTHYSPTSSDAGVIKFDNTGLFLSENSVGSENDDESASGMTVDANGNIYLIGGSAATWGNPVEDHPGGSAVLVVKLGVAPEIDLRGNGQSIPDGDSSPASDDGSDFGLVPLDGGTLTHTFTIHNTGEADLALTGSPLVEIGGTHAGDFTVTAQPASSVAPEASTFFTVRFDPGAIGTRSATVSIANNDSNETPYGFAIQGTGAWAVYLPLVLK